MIKIIPDPTTLDANLVRINKPIDRIAKRTIANIHDLNESFQAFWNLPDDQINEILNHHGIEATQAIFGVHNVNGAAFNKLLEDRGISTPRVILTAPRELQIVDGNLQVVPLPEPEVVEEVVEEPILEE
jgi:hypothetical protein